MERSRLSLLTIVGMSAGWVIHPTVFNPSLFFSNDLTVVATVNITALEQQTHRRVNDYRRSKNLPPLILDSGISDEARRFSQKMADKKAPFNHDGFEGRMKAVNRRIPLVSMAENIAFSKGYSDPAAVAVKGWIKSPGHEKNMRGDFDLTGIGIARNNRGEYYFTQLFVKKR